MPQHSRRHRIVSGESTCKPKRSTAYTSATGEDPKPRVGNSSVLPGMQPLPQIMVLRRCELLPPAGQHVSIRANSKIRAVNMRVGSIRMDHVAKSEPLRNLLRMLGERININNACDGRNT